MITSKSDDLSGKVSLFIPCLVDQLVPETGLAVVKVLDKLGIPYHYDKRQTCCGQALFNMGFRKEAAELAKKFLRIFADSEIVVTPSGSCASMVIHHYEELDLKPQYRNIWEELRSRVYEFSGFLVKKMKLSDLGAEFPHSVTLHNSCHQLRKLGDASSANILLKEIKGLTLIEGDWGDECCGFGGAFSAKYPELSQEMSSRRIKNLSKGNAEYITGTDDSCLRHLQLAAKRNNLSVKTIHIAQILASNLIHSKKDGGKC